MRFIIEGTYGEGKWYPLAGLSPLSADEYNKKLVTWRYYHPDVEYRAVRIEDEEPVSSVQGD